MVFPSINKHLMCLFILISRDILDKMCVNKELAYKGILWKKLIFGGKVLSITMI
jgi:hypothetical protein